MPETQPQQQKELITKRSFDLKISKRAQEDGSASANLVLEFPFSSETPYLRQPFFDDPWVEILGHGKNEVDLSRLNDGAAVLINHGSGSTDDSPLRSIGKTVRAWIDGNRGYVEVKLSRRSGMEGLLRDIEDDLVPGVSVGYQIQERTLISEKEGQPSEYRVTKWMPVEITLCDVPADPTVGIGRSIDIINDEGNMGTNAKEKEDPVAPKIDQPTVADVETMKSQIRESAIAEERERLVGIGIAVRSAGLDAVYADELINKGVTLDEARAKVLEKLAERTEKTLISSRSDIITIVDETETRRNLMTEAILYRTKPSNKLSDGARQFAGLTMIDMARECLEAKGVKTRGLDRMQIASRAFEGTSDLTSILANTANKSLRQAYEAAPRTFTTWARQASASDFKTISRTNMSDAPALEKVTENGEFKRGIVTDGKETYQLATVGKIIGLTRQAIINDDLSAFTRIPAMFAVAAANYESDTVYGILTANAALSDNVALFHATHANLTGTGTVISIDSLGVGRKSLRRQKTPQGVVMNLAPHYLIVPAALESIAWQYTNPPIFPTAPASANPFMGELQVVVEGRLDDASVTSWYMAADTMQIDTIEYCYLEGQSGVYIETRQGFDVDGMEIKARLDFAAKAIDYRGLYKNVGA